MEKTAERRRRHGQASGKVHQTLSGKPHPLCAGRGHHRRRGHHGGPGVPLCQRPCRRPAGRHAPGAAGPPVHPCLSAGAAQLPRAGGPGGLFRILRQLRLPERGGNGLAGGVLSGHVRGGRLSAGGPGGPRGRHPRPAAGRLPLRRLRAGAEPQGASVPVVQPASGSADRLGPASALRPLCPGLFRPHLPGGLAGAPPGPAGRGPGEAAAAPGGAPFLP